MNWNRPQPPADARLRPYGIVGASQVIADVIRRIELVAATRSTTLITGETGTGKELVARAVHACSAERAMPFVKVNCAAIPDALLESELFGHLRGAFTGATSSRKGKFAMANGGTILLDEIGTMGLGLQAKILRVLQEREFEPLGSERVESVNVRVIAATNRDLRQMVCDRLFQEDLYYRLQVVPIVVPPLRDRPGDIPPLAKHFTEKHAKRNDRQAVALDDDAVGRLQLHDWPGNVRELENTIERAVVLTKGDVLTADTITVEAARVRRRNAPSMNLRESVEWIERETIVSALRASTKKQDAARLMGITPRALSHYLAKYPSLSREACGSVYE